MTETTTDRWALGASYDAYMGRWSRQMARVFLGWLHAEPGGHWLELGCGTGALTSTVCALSTPASVVACDQSASFIEHARRQLEDPRVSYEVATAEALPRRRGGFDLIVSGLVLNFIADPTAALVAMRARARAGGRVAAYVWDYAGGVEFLRHFWEAASASDPDAGALDEARRFGDWREDTVTARFRDAGLTGIESTTLTIPTDFASFDDYWQPFLGGTGPAPSYVASLSQPQRDRLAEGLRSRLPRAADGSIQLKARALAVNGLRA